MASHRKQNCPRESAAQVGLDRVHQGRDPSCANIGVQTGIEIRVGAGGEVIGNTITDFSFIGTSSLPHAHGVLAEDPKFGAYLGVATQAQVTANGFCNVTTQVVKEAMATDIE